MARYDNDDFHQRKDFLIGDANQLSSVLEAQAKQDPVRFARLVTQLPDTAPTAYYDAILRGVAESERDVPLDLIEAMILRCHALPDRPCGRWIARPLRHHAETLSEPRVDVITWYATIDADPTADRDGGDERAPDDCCNTD